MSSLHNQTPPLFHSQKMTLLTNPPFLLNPKFKMDNNHTLTNYNPHRRLSSQHKIQAATKLSSNEPEEETETQNLHRRRRRRRSVLFTVILAVGSANVKQPEAAMAAQNWGTRSRLWERFFGSELSPEESAERIKLTAQGFHTLREMLENFTWRYVLTYIRTKKSYLSQDMKNAMVLVPQAQRKSYIDTANELVDNLNELDNYVRTPKIYESYLYYEKALKSIDDLVAFLA